MTKMASCYPNYELSISQGFNAAPILSKQHQSQQQRHRQMPQQLQQKQKSYMSSAAGGLAVAVAKNYINTPKNYFVPLHVDCSVEYELPKQPKPPAGQRVEPLLMIHPCYFRKMESQRRSPFINNMPNTSRNGAATFVGVALVSKCSNIALASASALSLKRTSVRNYHHHYNTRQNVSSQYDPINNTDQQQQLQQLPNKQQLKSQHNLSLMPQLVPYPVGSPKFLENSSIPIQRTAIAIFNRTNQIICSTHQTKNQNDQQDDHLVHNSSSPSRSAAVQWDQLAAVKSSMADHNPNKLSSASINNLCEASDCSIVASSTLGKRDAMISGSGGYSTNSASASNNISLRNQINKSGSNNITSSGKNNNKIKTNRSSYGISTCLVDSTKRTWNPKTIATSSLFMIDRSPIATVPSNFQAGPDTTQKPLQHKYRTLIDTNNKIINKIHLLNSSEKFRHYLRSHRAHPYITGTSSHLDSTALSSKSVIATRGNFQVLPQFSAAKSAAAAMSTVNSFQQQISCYNV